jgi:hypothetical protein
LRGGGGVRRSAARSVRRRSEATGAADLLTGRSLAPLCGRKTAPPSSPPEARRAAAAPHQRCVLRLRFRRVYLPVHTKRLPAGTVVPEYENPSSTIIQNICVHPDRVPAWSGTRSGIRAGIPLADSFCATFRNEYVFSPRQTFPRNPPWRLPFSRFFPLLSLSSRCIRIRNFFPADKF